MKRLPIPTRRAKTPEMKQFGAHFEATVAAAAAGNIQAKPLEFFIPTSPAVDARFDSIRVKIHAKRMEQVDAWIRRELTPHLGADVCGLPNEAFAEAVRAAGIYGKEVQFREDEPGVMRFALYGRVEGGPDDLIAAMTFEPTFGIDKA